MTDIRLPPRSATRIRDRARFALLLLALAQVGWWMSVGVVHVADGVGDEVARLVDGLLRDVGIFIVPTR